MTVTMGVQTSDPSAQAALQRNNDRANALDHRPEGAGRRGQGHPDRRPQRVTQLRQELPCDGLLRVEHRFREAARPHKAGEVIDAAALTVGQDVRFQGVTFSIDNTSARLAQARADAIKDALAQAKQFAAAAGVKLGSIRTIDDTGSNVPQPLTYNQGGSRLRQPTSRYPSRPEPSS